MPSDFAGRSRAHDELVSRYIQEVDRYIEGTAGCSADVSRRGSCTRDHILYCWCREDNQSKRAFQLYEEEAVASPNAKQVGT